MTPDLQASPYKAGFLARTVPRLSPDGHAELVARISRHNYRPAVIVWQGEIVFGEELLEAYRETGVDPEFEHLADDADPWEKLAAEAVPALEMDANAKGVTAALASLYSPRGRPRAKEENSANLQKKTRGIMAERFSVSVRLVDYAASVLIEDGKAAPELRQAVREWKVNATDAARILEESHEVQARAVAMVLEGKTGTVKGAAEHVEREMVQAEEQAAMVEILAQPLDETITLHVAQVAEMLQVVPEASVDAIITNPPHVADRLFMYFDLAEFAAHALKPTGCLIVVGQGILLPGIMEALSHREIQWRWEGDLLFRGKPTTSGRPHHVRLHRCPLLIYGKRAFGLDPTDDLIEVAGDDELPPGLDRNDVAMELIVERFCRPGQVVCDPILLDRASTALAARKFGCTFVGATEEASSRDRIHARLVPPGKGQPGDQDAVEPDRH